MAASSSKTRSGKEFRNVKDSDTNTPPPKRLNASDSAAQQSMMEVTVATDEFEGIPAMPGVDADVDDSPPENTRPCGDCRKSMCPYCNCTTCKDGQCRACFAAYRNAMKKEAGSSSSSTPNPVMAKLEEMMKIMATKDDVKTLKKEILAETKVFISEAVDPLKSEIFEFKQRLAIVENAAGSTSAIRQNAETSRQVLDDTDPAFLQMAFTGFEGISAPERSRILFEFARQSFADVSVAGVEHSFSGPRNMRQLTDTSMLQFHSRDSRDLAMKQSDKKKVMNGTTTLNLKVAFARTKSQKSRNWALRKATELINVDLSKRNSVEEVSIQWEMPTRKILVGTTVAFEQGKLDLRGNFCGQYTTLTLPK
jgi:hypothetical protein